MAVECRLAGPGDVDGIQRVAEAAWYAAHAPIVGEGPVTTFLAEHYDPTRLRSQVDDGSCIVEVAVSGGEVVGFAWVVPADGAPGTYSLARLYVAPDRWAEGIGSRLLDRAERRALQRGGRRLTLGVIAANERAVGFYESAGYRRVDAFHDDRLDAEGYTYAKSL